MVILMVLSLALPIMPGLERRMTIGDAADDGFRLPESVSGSASGIRSRPIGTGLAVVTVVVAVVVAALGIVVFVAPSRRSDVIENFFVAEIFFSAAGSGVVTLRDPSVVDVIKLFFHRH